MKFIKGLILVLALSVVSCGSGEKRADAPRKVKCATAIEVSETVEPSSFPGRVVAADDLNLGFRVAGIIDDICVADGVFVRKGDVIARLDNRDYALQLSATQAEYDAVKAEVDRVVALYADKSVSANDYDKATNGLRAITAKLNAHENALADTELRAPMAGYINKGNFSKGEAVAAGTPVVSMISSSAPQVTIDVPALYYLKQGNFESATATIDLYGDEKFNLKLIGVSPKANLNQLYRVSFTIEPVDGKMPAVGMSAMVEMNYSVGGDRSVVIPFSAIVEREGASYVWIFEDGQVASRKIEVAEIKRNGTARLVGGVEAGEVVVAAGVNSLKEGQEVALLEEASASNVGGIK